MKKSGEFPNNQPVYQIRNETKIEGIENAIRSSVESQGLPELGYTAYSIVQELVNKVAKIYLVIRNESNGQEYVYKNVSDRLVEWWYDSALR
ncbi:hypothetical protein PABY_06870 [Pyrodictium abyssi]|uniref:Uncharacterized protein n=1 Tax=Pyrodictium abyssi TaxID=54256 RepID=A0ABM8IU85_9CREN|nr:hypothetical protein PABY_06870 [Pyrodictium abyssi]